MEWKKNLFFAGLSALILPIGLSYSTRGNAETIIKLETYAGPKHAMNSVAWPKWIKELESKNVGLKVRMTYPPINPRDLYDRVRDGIADMAWITHGYTTGRFVLTKMIELPGMNGNAEQMSDGFWKTYTKCCLKFKEHKGVVLLSLFTHGPGMIHTRIPIPNIEALKGLKIRTGGGIQSAIAKRLGIVSVSAPATKAQELLSQGVADGIFFSIETIWSFRLGNVIKYSYALPGGLYTSSFAVVMNPRKFASLTAKQKKALMSVSGEHLARLIGRAWDGADRVAYRELSKKGNTITTFDPKMAAEIYRKLADMDDTWIAQAKKMGLSDPAAVLKQLRAAVQVAKQYK